MWAEVHIDNVPGYVCYGCNQAVTVDLFHLPDLSHPYGWLCSTCLVAKLRDGTLSLTTAQSNASGAGCDSCECDISVGEPTYCESCYDSRYDEGMGDATSTCDNCGDDSSVYCIGCAREQWELTDEYPECDLCSDPADHHLCSRHKRDITERAVTEAVVNAQAADGIEVNWGD